MRANSRFSCPMTSRMTVNWGVLGLAVFRAGVMGGRPWAVPVQVARGHSSYLPR